MSNITGMFTAVVRRLTAVGEGSPAMNPAHAPELSSAEHLVRYYLEGWSCDEGLRDSVIAALEGMTVQGPKADEVAVILEIFGMADAEGWVGMDRLSPVLKFMTFFKRATGAEAGTLVSDLARFRKGDTGKIAVEACLRNPRPLQESPRPSIFPQQVQGVPTPDLTRRAEAVSSIDQQPRSASRGNNVGVHTFRGAQGQVGGGNVGSVELSPNSNYFPLLSAFGKTGEQQQQQHHAADDVDVNDDVPRPPRRANTVATTHASLDRRDETSEASDLIRLVLAKRGHGHGHHNQGQLGPYVTKANSW